MKKVTLVICATAFLFAACNNESKTETTNTDSSGKTASATAPNTETEAPYVAPDSATMMKAMMDNATPGEMHKAMSSTDGAWECEVTHWMSEGQPAQQSKATASYKTVLNGLYQEGMFKGTFAGMPPFEGKSVMGYDNIKEKFFSTWYDNMSSGLMTMEGTYDPGTKTYTLAGTATNPLTKKDCHMREIVKIVDDNTQKMELYGPDPMTNKEYKTMEIVMKRKK